jgi:hypothetical protein
MCVNESIIMIIHFEILNILVVNPLDARELSIN